MGSSHEGSWSTGPVAESSPLLKGVRHEDFAVFGQFCSKT